jgi:hypothetical protein
MVHLSNRVIAQANRRLDQTLYFNPRKRRRLELSILRMKAFAEKCLPELGDYPPDEQESILSMAKIAELYLEIITTAKVEVAGQKLTKRRFVMYKHPFGSAIVIIFRFYKAAENCFKENAAVYPHGLTRSAKRRVKAYFFHHAVDVSGYQEIERGRFREKYLSFNHGTNTLWNRHFKIRYFIYANPHEPGTQYCRLIDGNIPL